MQVRLIRVFVSSPGDVARERDVVDEVVAAINRTDGDAGSFRLETIRWEANVTPQIGPRPQTVVDQQTPGYDVYLGIMSTRFGTPTGHHGSGTEKEFKDALKQWKSAGQPWITFYFDDAPKSLSKPQEIKQFLKVSEFRERLQEQGIVRSYHGVRGSKDGFYEQVVGVSYWEAEAFAKWIGGRLPTAHEWEAAARGPNGSAYPWGDDWEDGICNSAETKLGQTSPVGIFPRSRTPTGLEDMAGNVWEWCADAGTTPWEAGGRVVRSGCWGNDSRSCRSAYRNALVPSYRLEYLGFRVAAVPLGSVAGHGAER
jgi:hypothetical protein